MTTRKRAKQTITKATGEQTVISNVRIDMGESQEEMALIAAVHRALDVLHQIRLTPRYGIYVEASRDEH